MWCLLLLTLGTPQPKLPDDISKEMQAAIIAVDKALGLESYNDKPCVDRGGQYGRAKEVSAEDTKKCAESALAKGFPLLGKGYVLVILMAQIGPMTVIALATGDNSDWGAYSCDPGRKCLPVRMSQDGKWQKRMAERRARACADPATVWLPAGQKVCPGKEVEK
jgi:hypothetical protein